MGLATPCPQRLWIEGDRRHGQGADNPPAPCHARTRGGRPCSNLLRESVQLSVARRAQFSVGIDVGIVVGSVGSAAFTPEPEHRPIQRDRPAWDSGTRTSPFSNGAGAGMAGRGTAQPSRCTPLGPIDSAGKGRCSVYWKAQGRGRFLKEILLTYTVVRSSLFSECRTTKGDASCKGNVVSKPRGSGRLGRPDDAASRGRPASSSGRPGAAARGRERDGRASAARGSRTAAAAPSRRAAQC